MAITDGRISSGYATQGTVPAQGTYSIGANTISGGKINADSIDLKSLREALLGTEDQVVRMSEVIADLASRLGITMDEAARSLEASALTIKARDVADNGPQVSRQRMSVGVDEYGLLVRVANMAGQLLTAMREAEIDQTEHARYTALRNALVALQIHETTLAVDPLGENELAADLARLVSELEDPTTPPST